MDDEKKTIRLVLDGSESDPKKAVKLTKETQVPETDRQYTGFRVQPAINGGYVLHLEHTGPGPSDLYYCENKEELIELLRDCLA
jgi:hypothetical protein